MHRGAIYLITLALAGSPAFATDAPAPDKSAKPATASVGPAKADSQDKLTCTREQITGSVFFKKVCRTPAQIEQDRKEARQLNDYRQQGGSARALPGAN
jgi:hypothetical protein